MIGISHTRGRPKIGILHSRLHGARCVAFRSFFMHVQNCASPIHTIGPVSCREFNLIAPDLPDTLKPYTDSVGAARTGRARRIAMENISSLRLLPSPNPSLTNPEETNWAKSPQITPRPYKSGTSHGQMRACCPRVFTQHETCLVPTPQSYLAPGGF
jgi:hypothetical protein